MPTSSACALASISALHSLNISPPSLTKGRGQSEYPLAKLLKLPGQEVIDGFKGKVDYYIHDGVACARSWPRSPGHNRAPAVQDGWTSFAWAASNWNSLSPAVQEAYNRTAKGTHLTGRDLFTKNLITNAYLELT